MALIHCDFFSKTLELATSMCVILPESHKAQRASAQKKHPTLYLLHGLSDDHNVWQRRTSIERYVEHLGLAVVMPNVHRSFYADMLHGSKYWTFISEELPSVARSFFHLSSAREDNFVAGLSMGGYGAFKWALTHPQRFAAAASLSGALDLTTLNKNYTPELNSIFGSLDQIHGSDADVFHLAEKISKSGSPKPLLYQCCGTEDFLYKDNVRFQKFAKKLKLKLTYEEGPGEHEWDYWDQQIQRVLRWLPL